MRRSGSVMFHELARYYDVYLSGKDYRGESRRLETIAHRYGRTGGPASRGSWLDVGCGTGGHLEYLRKRHPVAGVDLSPEMLRLARIRLPGISLRIGDARTFRFGRTFDVVSCVFGLLGHIEQERDVRRVFERISAHLTPGGVAIVEPWIDPAHYRPGFIHLMVHDDSTTKAVRLSYSTRRGRRLVVRSHYLLATRGRPVRHLGEVSVGLMIPPDRLVRMMEDVGLRARFLPRGLIPGRGLLVGTKPRARSA